MKERAKKILKHPLIYGSSIFFVGNLAANFFNFLFNLFMSRTLSVAEYGVLASVVSLLAFPSLAATAIQPMVVRFAGDYFASKKLAMVRGLYVKIMKPFFLLTLSLFILFAVAIYPISNFFHITDISILVIADFIILIGLIFGINSAFIQAKLAFVFLVGINIIGSLSKLILGVIFVFAGLSAKGAVLSLFGSTLVTFFISYLPIKFVFDRKIVLPKIDTGELFTYGIPSAFAFFGLTSLISSDIILVKHFMSPNVAGIYAGLSLVGKVIFYLTAPIGTVMFPLIVQKHSKNENFTNTFKLSLLITFIPSIILVAGYFLFPKQVILFFLKNNDYLAASSLLGIFGLTMSLYCLLTLITSFFLSIKKTKVFIPIVIGAFLQIIFICIFHLNLLQVISITLTITFLLLLSLLLYYPYAIKK